MASEVEAASFTSHTEDGDIVASLIAAIEELAGRVEVEASWVVAACPFLPNKRQVAFWAYGKDADAVVQPIARIDKSAIG